MMLTVPLSLLVFHGVVGGIDVLLNHEIVERLPSRVSARVEQALHSARELVFGVLFGGLAWIQWQGALVWVIAGLLLAEISISLIDTLLEDKTRMLSAVERTLHVILFVNFGAYVALLSPHLIEWHSMPTSLTLIDHGYLSLALSALSIASIGWSIRDAVSYRKLSRAITIGKSLSPVA